MEIYLNNPAEWQDLRITFSYKVGVNYERLFEVDSLVDRWKIYHFYTTRRLPPKVKERFKKLDKEYFLAVNGLVGYLYKLLFWASLQK